MSSARTPTAIDPAEITLLVIAKQPLPGKAKTRLAPALGERGAAGLAEAALADTLATIATVPGARRRLLALEGETGPWLPDGFELTGQRGEGLGARLGAAFADAGGPALLVGMDTPQITVELIASCRDQLAAAGTDAVIGLADDGGWWALGLREPDPEVFAGVPMSESGTGAAQLEALGRLGLSYEQLPVLRDVDTVEDAIAVAGEAPHGRFAAAVEAAGIPLETRAA